MSDGKPNPFWQLEENGKDFLLTEAVCDRFEVELRESRYPAIEEAVREVPAELQPQLTRDLLELELEYRIRRDAHAAIDQLRRRFPAWQQLIDEAIAASKADDSTPGEGVETQDYERAFPHDTVTFLRDYSAAKRKCLGAFGPIYLAKREDCEVDIWVVSGLSRVRSRETRTLVGAFGNALKQQSRLRHRNIMEVRKIWLGEHPACFVTEPAGKSLFETVQANPVPPDLAASYALEITEAIAHAHDSGLFHNTLSPHFVRVAGLATDSPRLVVASFGLGRFLGAFADPEAVRPGPEWFAPESEMHGSGSIATDVYSIGAILYYMLTASPPVARVGTMPRDPVQINGDIHPALADICLNCLREGPPDRYPSARAVARDLAAYINAKPPLPNFVQRGFRHVRCWLRRQVGD